MHLEDGLTPFILRFYNFARRLIFKLQKNVISTPVCGQIIGITDQNTAAQCINQAIAFLSKITFLACCTIWGVIHLMGA